MTKEAKVLHDLGFAIIWLRPNSKAPVESGWTQGPRHDFDILRKTFQPGQNMGVRLGDVSYFEPGCLAVLDCDVKSADPEHLREMKEALSSILPGYNSGPIVLSGRGGGSQHIYLLVPNGTAGKKLLHSKHKVKTHMPSVKASEKDKLTLTPEEIEAGFRSRNAWEIDLLANGRQVVLPPSIHPDTGHKYKWADSNMKAKEFVGRLPRITPKQLEEWNKLTPTKESSTSPATQGAIRAEVNLNAIASPDVLSLKISDKMKSSILYGEDVEDRSAFLLKAALAILGAGHTPDEALGILTDPDTYIGQAGYEHAKTKDRKVAGNWINKYTLGKAQKIISEEKSFAEECVVEYIDPEEFKQQVAEGTDWRDALDSFGDGASRGKPKPTLRNLVLALELGLDGFIRRNLVKQRDEFIMATPWGKAAGLLLEDDDVSHLKLWLETFVRFPKVPSELLNDALIVVATRNAYDPLKDYLEGLQWDGVCRLDTWLSKYVAAPGEETYLSAIGRKFLLAMVTRAFKPGAKFDQVLILEGAQGIGKSTLAKVLGGPFFSDADIKLGSKDTIQLLQGSWVVEMGELTAMRKSEIEEMKKFITQTHDDIRLPYARRVNSFPRRFCLIGTTNSEEYLKDPTGNRRFWPTKCADQIDIEGLSKVRDQLFAEAVHAYRFGEETLFLDTEELREIAANQTSDRETEDPIVREVAIVVETLDQFGGFTIRDIWNLLNPLSNRIPEHWETQRYGYALKKLGFEVRRARVDGVKTRLYSLKNELNI